MTETTIEPFVVRVADDVVSDLRDRLDRTRWPDQIGEAWEYGTDRAYLEGLCRYWRDEFDWRAFEARHNRFPQFSTRIDGQRIHFLHARSPEPAARPLLLTHGWPGSVTEFLAVVGPLSDPVAHGGEPADAFHVVVPSLPGYGFSGPTAEPGWSADRMADAFAELMTRLGYPRFLAQGGDWGSTITQRLAARYQDRLARIHLNLLHVPPPPGASGPDLADYERVMGQFLAQETGYSAIQSTRPQTLSYGLTDSPAGLAGWIVEKFRRWSDCSGDVERSFARDRLLDNISIYWVTGTINSSIRMYAETNGPGRRTPEPTVRVPVGHAVYPAEIVRVPRAWAEQAFDIVHWAQMPRGGHFAAMEVPDLFVEDVRDCFRDVGV